MSEEHMIALYDGADLFFRPLAFATANNALLEAMAMGKGIVVHRIPGVTDYLDASTAFLAQDDEEFLAQFQYAVDHPEERMKRGQRARARVESEFAWEHVAGKTVAIYEQVKK
jgi:glycosyltransferase involved in cell wall biosynthesis